MASAMTLFKPLFTPIPPDLDIACLVAETPNFHWCLREDVRSHAAPFQKLNQIIRVQTIEKGTPIVLENWHLRSDWNATLFSPRWLDHELGSNGSFVTVISNCRNRHKGPRQTGRHFHVHIVLPLSGPVSGRSRLLQ
jgi:hypothetical protein